MKQFQKLVNKAHRNVIGLMSGTSCDGVDAALVGIAGTGQSLRAELLDFAALPYAPEFAASLKAPHDSAAQLCELNVALGHHLADAALGLMRRAQHAGRQVDVIGSHGHTIVHIPPSPKHPEGSTMQLSEPAVIAEKTGLPVVSNFRSRDMAAGGHGAPLVPYADSVLFSHPEEVRVCLNIGGIANVTVVLPGARVPLAFDTGPGNMPIDDMVRHLTNSEKTYDQDGAMARSGNPDHTFVESLLHEPFFDATPPKSTGREAFGFDAYLEPRRPLWQDLSVVNTVASITAAVAKSIAAALHNFVIPHHPISRVIASGGGVYNPTLMDSLRQELSPIPIDSTDDYGWPADAKEAVAFAILANECICGAPANIPAATGATKAVILGNVTPP